MELDRRTEGVRASCRVAAAVMAAVQPTVRAGSSTLDVDAVAAETMRRMGVRSAFLGHHGFPGSVCISINEEVLHGIPSRTRTISPGDIVKVDLGVVKDGFYSDMAQTFVIDDGEDATRQKRSLMDAALSALMAGIAAVKDGEKVLAVATAISGVLRSRGYEPIDGMSGHGVGVRLHEPPQVPNRIEGWDCSAVMRRGMTLAIEPMVGLGSPKARFRSDGWTVVMSDGLPSAHFEHTVLVTDGQAEVLTVV